MKYTFILLFTFLMISCERNINLRITETTETATAVKGNRFEGVIFSETMELDTVYEKRFTPTIEEIELAETVLRKQWKTLEPSKKFKDFSRQYAGIIDKEGKKIILMNFLYKKVSVFLCMSLFPNYLKIDKEALKKTWLFPNDDNHQHMLFGGVGVMTQISFHIKNQEIMNKSCLPISAGFDKNGKPKPFPYGEDLYSDYLEYEKSDTVKNVD